MDAPIVSVDRKAFKDAFKKAAARVATKAAGLYVDGMFESVDASVRYGNRMGARPEDLESVAKRLKEMSEAVEMMSDFFNNASNDVFSAWTIEPHVEGVAKLLRRTE